jgi:hypothetical protein
LKWLLRVPEKNWLYQVPSAKSSCAIAEMCSDGRVSDLGLGAAEMFCALDFFNFCIPFL